jgi:hypothetical protein
MKTGARPQRGASGPRQDAASCRRNPAPTVPREADASAGDTQPRTRLVAAHVALLLDLLQLLMQACASLGLLARYPRLVHIHQRRAKPRKRPRVVRMLASREVNSAITNGGDLSPGPAADSLSEVEVAHEAPVQHCPRLKAWLDEDRAALLLCASVREAAREWGAQQRDEIYLMHRGRRLFSRLRMPRPLLQCTGH